MKNRIVLLGLILPMLVIGCDSLFDKGDVEKTYDGPDQVGFFPLEDNNNLGCAVQSTTIQVQLISSNGTARSAVPVNFSAAGGSTARATTDYSFGTPSPVTIAAGETTANIDINFVVTTVDVISVDPKTMTDDGDFDAARTFGTYSGLTATGASGTGATFNVTVPAFGQLTTASDTTDADPLRTAGTYNNVSATGGSGAGAVFDVVIDAAGAATVTIDTTGAGTRYVAGEFLTIPALGNWNLGSDIVVEVTGVSAQAAPSVAVATGGTGYACSDTFTFSDAQLGGGGAGNLVVDVGDLTGSFAADEVLLLLQMDGSDARVAANLDSTNVFMAD